MSHPLHRPIRQLLATAALAAVTAALAAPAARASDHLDSPTVIADPRADIGDLYAWIAPDGRHLNLAMTLVGHSFSDRLTYSFFVDSGPRYGKTPASTEIVCQFPAPDLAECRVEDIDFARGDASGPAGLEGRDHRFRVFAGRRDDPFFNNVRGTRAAYNLAAEALKSGAAARDAAGCPVLSATQAQGVLDAWRHTDGGPGANFLARWSIGAIVVQVDLDLVTTGGPMLAVWATTASGERQIDRMGRPLTGNALLGTIATEEQSNRMKEAYNAATPTAGAPFVDEIAQGLALYDGFDGRCGNQWLADAAAPSARRYLPLARLLADDRLWVDSGTANCTQLFGVELAALGRAPRVRDCGGRSPTYDAVNVYRSQLADGTNAGVDDGVHRDDHALTADFPYLAAPDAQAVDH